MQLVLLEQLNSPFFHLQNSFQAKVDFRIPGASYTRIHFGCDPSGSWVT